MASTSSDSVKDQLDRLLKEFVPIMAEEFSGNPSEEPRRRSLENRDKGITALHLAASLGYADLCKHLIEILRYNVNAQGLEQDDTPLHAATMKNHFATVECLIDHGANVNSKTKMGFTPLHIAAMQGYEELVRLLVHKDSNIEATSATGTPLLCAVSRAQLETVRVLLEETANAGADPNTCINGTTPLCHAASLGLNEIIKHLLNAGADPNAIDVYGSTPLENAAYQGHRESMKILFPITSRNPSCRQWTLRGIMQHINSEEIRRQREIRKKEIFRRAKLKGDEATKRNEYCSAIQLYSVAIDAKPHDATVYSDRSHCYACLSDGYRALSDAKSCIRLMPHWPVGYYREGVAWKLLKNYRNALEAFSMALTLDPNSQEFQNAVQYARMQMASRR